MAKNGKSFFQRLRFKYKIAILNENTLEEIWRIRLSKLSAIVFCFFIAVVYFFMIAFLIIKTPLRGFLPGYTENIVLRKQLRLNALTIDSIASELEVQTQYMNTLRLVLAGELKADSTFCVDSLKAISAEELMGATEREQNFRNKYEEEELIAANTPITDLNEDRNYLIQSPAKGRLVEAFNERTKMYGVVIAAEHNSSISSILDGVIISSEYNVHNQYILTIQHPDNMLSQYRVKQPFLKKVGEKVHAGEILTTFRADADTYFEFQLWKEGVVMDPQSFVSF